MRLFKNKWLMLLGPVLMLASCGANEEPKAPIGDTGEVTFTLYLKSTGSSRASELNVEKLKDSGFGVLAYMTGASSYPTDGTAAYTPDFMYNEFISHNGEAWDYSPHKYWPNSSDYKISFFAYAPYGGAGVELQTNSDVGDPWLKYTVDEDAKNQIDLVYAAARDKTNSGPVDLTFNHALTKIAFSGELDSSVDANSKVVLKRLALRTDEDTDVAFSAKLNLLTGIWFDKEYQDGEYLVYENASGLDIGATKAAITGNSADSNDYVMLIPFTYPWETDPDDAAVWVDLDYEVCTEDDTNPLNSTIIENHVEKLLPLNLMQGRAVRVNLSFGFDVVSFASTSEAWAD